MSATLLLTISEVREAMRNRALLAASGGFALLCAALTFAGSSAGSTGFGPAAAGLVNIELIAVPLVALVLGAMTIARDRERGTYGYVRALPVTLFDIYRSKALATAVSVSAVVFAGFAGAFCAMAIFGERGGDVAAVVQFALLTWLLGMACAALGMLISVCSRRTLGALSAAVASWLLLVVFGDLGIMASALATRMNLALLLTITAANPVEAYKIASLAALRGSVDVLGPGGRLAADVFGSAIMPVLVGVLAAWAILAFCAGWLILARTR